MKIAVIYKPLVPEDERTPEGYLRANPFATSSYDLPGVIHTQVHFANHLFLEEDQLPPSHFVPVPYEQLRKAILKAVSMASKDLNSDEGHFANRAHEILEYMYGEHRDQYMIFVK